MADKKNNIPEWQRQSAPTPSEQDLDKPSATQTSAPESESRASLIEQARTFLAHDEIKDASTESKISFLEEKGLSNEEIQELLGVSRNETSAPEPAVDVVEKPQPSTDSSKSAEPGQPPIITYPEFLIHASKPPPLVTPERALKTVYGATLIGGAIYGASKFILQPMFESLSEARHDLFSVTKERLVPLNKKIEGMVSTIPPSARAANVGHERRNKEEGDGDDDGSSIASDPTELFHRDIAVQTSPPASPTLSASAGNDVEKLTPTGHAVSRLSSLREHLDSLLQSSNTVLATSDDAKRALKETEIYLDQIRYGEGVVGYGGPGSDSSWRAQMFGNKVAGMGSKTDAVDDLKADIRAMKGAMLGARNFPRGVK